MQIALPWGARPVFVNFHTQKSETEPPRRQFTQSTVFTITLGRNHLLFVPFSILLTGLGQYIQIITLIFRWLSLGNSHHFVMGIWASALWSILLSSPETVLGLLLLLFLFLNSFISYLFPFEAASWASVKQKWKSRHLIFPCNLCNWGQHFPSW